MISGIVYEGRAMDRSVYVDRRKAVLEAIEPGVLVLPAAPVALRNGDVEHDYRQHSDLLYLTGFEEPGTVLVLATHRERQSALFVRPRDPEREVWDGVRAGPEGAVSVTGVDEAYPNTELDQRLAEFFDGAERLYYELGRDRAFDERVLRAIAAVRARASRGAVYPTAIIAPSVVLHPMRLMKTEPELQAMRRAAALTAEAHLAAMRCARVGCFEYELEAAIGSAFLGGGSRRAAYGTIVASGPNATVLHHRTGARRVEADELVLVDAGCEVEGYAADVTRTFPASGRFTEAQRALYEVVLEAEARCIEAVRPGTDLKALQELAVQVLTEGLVRLEIIRGPVEDAIREERYKPYYMHRVSHYLGLDVHDVGAYFADGKPVPLARGMVLTIEPGLYIGAGSAAPEAYRGIGIRIEDDVLVTEEGSEVLTRAVPKTLDEVERACQGEGAR